MSSWNMVRRKVRILHLDLNPTPETWTITWEFSEKYQETLIYFPPSPGEKNLASEEVYM